MVDLSSQRTQMEGDTLNQYLLPPGDVVVMHQVPFVVAWNSCVNSIGVWESGSFQ